MYLDPAEHKTITGAEVTIGREIGCEFRAFDGVLTGVILAVIKPRLIVQSWRSSLFKPDDLDSTLILTFTSQGEHGQIDLVYFAVLDHDYDSVTHDRYKYIWIPV